MHSCQTKCGVDKLDIKQSGAQSILKCWSVDASNRMARSQKQPVFSLCRFAAQLMRQAAIRQHAPKLASNGDPVFREEHDIRVPADERQADLRHASGTASVQNVPMKQTHVAILPRH